ncbi:MAG: phasin family protein [Cyanobacteria bacterium J06642_2]
MDTNSLLRQLLLMGIGTTTLVTEKVQKSVDELVKNGRLDPNEAKQAFDDIMSQLEADRGNLESAMQRQVRNVMQDMGVPRQSEMDELRGRLDRLERQLRAMEERVYR